MTILTAQIAFVAIMTIAVCIWLHALIRVLRVGNEQSEDRFTPGDENADQIIGSHVVQGDQESVSRAIAKSVLGQSQLELTCRETDRVTVTNPHHMLSGTFQEIGFGVTPLGYDTTRIDYCISFGNMTQRIRRFNLRLLLMFKLPLFAGLGTVIWTHCVNSPIAGQRSAIFFMIFMFLGLWIPFAMIGGYRNARTSSRKFMTKVLQSVELTEGVAAMS